MIKNIKLIIIGLIFIIGCADLSTQEILHHGIRLEIDHNNAGIKVTDTLKNYKQFVKDNSLLIELHELFTVSSVNDSLKYERTPRHRVDRNRLTVYYVVSIPDNYTSENLIIKYSGEYSQEEVEKTTEFARSGATYDVLINTDGAYLSRSSYWYPIIKTDFFTFDISVITDPEYKMVSQGELVSQEVVNNKRTSIFSCKNPMDDIYVISGPFHTFEEEFDGIKVQAYLRSNDKELADKYIKATEGFLDTYNELIGMYPYTKFTLVENTAQTGWGMPSFTLLGSKIIRFPFILYSSYPHELLHNWWGNSVYVDYSKGNWCEGLTSYLADHLIKEQSGKGSEYRKDAVERYTLYVPEAFDSPIKNFRSKEGSVSEAIGYGKVLMVFHTLRINYGDDIFKQFLRELYSRYKFKKVSFKEIFDLFEEISGKDQDEFFAQWIEGFGAPMINIKNASVQNNAGKYQMKLELEQIQPNRVFSVDIPIYVKLEGSDKLWKSKISNSQKLQSYDLEFDSKPEQIHIDPLYDVMRRLLPNESEPTISRLFGDSRSYIIVPSESKMKDTYQKLAESWKDSQLDQGKIVRIFYDDELDEIPSDYAVWILGKDNKYYDKAYVESKIKAKASEQEMQSVIDGADTGSFVIVFHNEKNPAKSVGYINADSEKAIEALTRKLPHYGKYSYLGFKGGDAENYLKGIFEVKDNPMIFSFTGEKRVIEIPEHEPLTK